MTMQFDGAHINDVALEVKRAVEAASAERQRPPIRMRSMIDLGQATMAEQVTTPQLGASVSMIASLSLGTSTASATPLTKVIKREEQTIRKQPKPAG
jgi:hypothetical protein